MLRTKSQTRTIFFTKPLALLLTGLALGCGWWALQRGMNFAILALHYSAPLDGQEGMALWEASLLRSGQGLYLPLTPDRFVSAPYPPLHPLLLALLGFTTGEHPFWAGRLISLVAGLATAFGGICLVRRVSHSWIGGLVAGILVLSFAPFQIWMLRIKPDILGLLLTVVGLLCAAYWKRETQPRRNWHIPLPLLFAALLFVAAHFTKQTMLAAPLATGTLLLLWDRWLALRWALFYIGMLGLCWVTLDLITHGQYTFHVWTLHQLPWTWERCWKLVSQLRDAWPLLLLGVLALVATRRQPNVTSMYLLWAPASLIGAGVAGSNHNHLLETGLALALAGGHAVGWAITNGGRSQLIAPILLATQLLLWHTPEAWFAGDFTPDPDYNRYIDFVRATPGEVMADDIALLYAAGRPLRYDDPAAMGPASAAGLWDASHFVSELRAAHFSAIILPIDLGNGIEDPSGRWTHEMLQAIQQGYEAKFQDTLTIYTPRTP